MSNKHHHNMAWNSSECNGDEDHTSDLNVTLAPILYLSNYVQNVSLVDAPL